MRASKPAPAAPSWKQPASYIFLTPSTASFHPSSPENVVLPAARSAFHSGLGPYTDDDASVNAKIPGLAGTVPANAASDTPLSFATVHCCRRSPKLEELSSLTPISWALASLKIRPAGIEDSGTA